MSFKLLAIRPLKDCNEDFLKNLQIGKIYKFYEEYEFYNENEYIDSADYVGIVNRIEYKQMIPQNLYGSKINISAIVGKNGSGKSSLIELLYVAFYNLSVNVQLIQNIKADEKINKKIGHRIAYLSMLNNLLTNRLENEINSDKDVEEIENLTDFFSSTILELDKQKTKTIYRDIIPNINVEIFTLINEEEILVLKFINNKIDLHKEILGNKFNFDFNNVNSDLDLNQLFYNIVINYSFYGLNSKEVGDWVESLFHKNDGYQTPIVLNPMKTNGIIDINRESSLAKQRFLYNITSNKSLAEVTPNRKIEKIILKIKEKEISKINIFLNGEERYSVSGAFERIILKFFFNYNQLHISDNDKLNIIIMKYILDKLMKIKNTYEIYNYFGVSYDDNLKIYNFSKDYSEFFKKLNDDNSHITYKLKQALNLLFFYNLRHKFYLKYRQFRNQPNFYDSINFSLDDLSISDFQRDSLNSYFTNKKSNIHINHLPPSIFEIDYKFHNGSFFSQLSSGEKQSIYSTSSILYHLINLNSAHENSTNFKYSNYNIVLDEIELYAHPEMQRKFIYNLVQAIDKLQIGNINGINIIFITHSPFILSDIPKSNVLFLTDGDLEKYDGENTFAENIHEMLTDGFFIGSTKGEFSIYKINEFLSHYKEYLYSKEKSFEVLKDKFIQNKNDYNLLIKMIGEEYIRKILENQLDELNLYFKIPPSKKDLKNQESLLMEQLSLLRKQIEDEEN